MQKKPSYTLCLLLIGLLTIGSFGCKKVDGINNSNVIETPYSLYFSDTAGALYNSNDGKNVKVVYPPDGFPCLAICTVDMNLLWAKASLFISSDNGKDFNYSFDSSGSYPGFACNGLPINLNQSMLLEIPGWNRVYCVANEPPLANYLGLRYNLYQGAAGRWYTEGLPDTNGCFGFYGNEPFTVSFTSLTLLADSVLCAYDARHNRYAYKTNTILWKETTGNPDAIYGIGSFHNQTGTPLPHCDINIPDTTARYSLGHFNNRLIAIDNKGCYDIGAYYSDDTGRNWLPYSGLPSYTPILCIASPFEEVCLVGTDGAGLYMLNLNSGVFEPNNNGLSRNLKIRSIAFKENIFKNNTVQQYIYLATDGGIFQSTDGGHNWILTIQGNYVAIY